MLLPELRILLQNGLVRMKKQGNSYDILFEKEAVSIQKLLKEKKQKESNSVIITTGLNHSGNALRTGFLP